jgi:3-phenylpropionate/trans-cinnamate dioxygenase ferredoxin reductase component
MPPGSILIVGAGLAGARCAETLRAEGFEGELVLVGEEPFPPYERPALSKEFLAGERSVEDLLLRPESFWLDRRIELALGERVVSIDSRAGTATTHRGTVFRWNALVLATGARPRRLPFPSPPGVHVLRTVAEASALRDELVSDRRLVVVGGGFVGAEVASTARALGLGVTMLEQGPAPFARLLGEELGALLSARYRAHGVDVRTGTRVAEFRAAANGKLRSVVLADGSEVACDVAVVAVGVEPALELCSPNSTRPIHVCGDAGGGPGHWTSAAASGIDLGRRLLGLAPLPRQPAFFWSDQFGWRIQLVGDPAGAAAVELDGDRDSFVARYLTVSGEAVAVLAANRPAAVGAFRRELAFAA